ncbi:MAG: hypothetical protein AAGA61_06525 [Pseudomonadota bacterium]
MRIFTARDTCRIVKWRFASGDVAISKNANFTDCVVLEKDAFDPDAVFMEDIVDDEVLPRLSLAVEGLTDTITAARTDLELRPADEEPAPIPASTELPAAPLDPEQLEVYGWESSIWRKVRGYLGF